jgi:type III secretion protein J
MRARDFRVALPLVALLALAGCKTQLNSNLSEMSANEEVALLLQNSIPAGRTADPKTGSFTVMVEQSRFADAVDLLRAHGLPRTHYDSIPDVFKGNGLVSSPTEERARMMYALGQELSHTISDIDGVLSAHVQIVTPDGDPLRLNPPPASASVFVRYKDGSHVADLVPQIKMLVADGVSGLSYDKVSVIMVPAALPADAAAPLPEMENVYGIWVYGGSAAIVRTIAAVLAGLLATALAAGGWALYQARDRLRVESVTALRMLRLR